MEYSSRPRNTLSLCRRQRLPPPSRCLYARDSSRSFVRDHAGTGDSTGRDFWRSACEAKGPWLPLKASGNGSSSRGRPAGLRGSPSVIRLHERNDALAPLHRGETISGGGNSRGRQGDPYSRCLVSLEFFQDYENSVSREGHAFSVAGVGVGRRKILIDQAFAARIGNIQPGSRLDLWKNQSRYRGISQVFVDRLRNRLTERYMRALYISCGMGEEDPPLQL